MKVRDDWSHVQHTWKVRHGKFVYYGHRVRPALQLKSRTAWAVAYTAGKRGVRFQQVIEECVEAWARAWEEQLGETDHRRFVESVPYYRREESSLEG